MEKIEINGKPFELYAKGELGKDSNPILAVGNQKDLLRDYFNEQGKPFDNDWTTHRFIAHAIKVARGEE